MWKADQRVYRIEFFFTKKDLKHQKLLLTKKNLTFLKEQKQIWKAVWSLKDF